MLKIIITETDQNFSIDNAERLTHVLRRAEEIIEKLLDNKKLKRDQTIIDNLDEVSTLLFDAQFSIHESLNAAVMNEMN